MESVCLGEMEGHSNYSLEFPANPGDPWSWRCLDVQGAASERFQSLEEVVSILPCWGGALGNR